MLLLSCLALNWFIHYGVLRYIRGFLNMSTSLPCQNLFHYSCHRFISILVISVFPI